MLPRLSGATAPPGKWIGHFDAGHEIRVWMYDYVRTFTSNSRLPLAQLACDLRFRGRGDPPKNAH
jgi:hypothetical protein